MMQKFLDMLSIQLQSKRTWASIASAVTLICTLWFPDQLTQALALVATLQTWAMSDAVRPAVSKWLTSSEKQFDVPEKVLSALRETMVQNAIGFISTSDKPAIVEAQTNDVH